MNEAPSAAVRAHPERLDSLIAACKSLKPVETGVVYPLSADALMGALEAAKDGLIAPVLVGPAEAIRALAKKEAPISARRRSSTSPMTKKPPRRPARWRGAAKCRR